jgi:hypothetical protein
MMVFIIYKMSNVNTNTEVINNFILILENMKLDPTIDQNEDIKKLMAKAANVAIKGCKPKRASTAYNDFVKAKMSELTGIPKDQKFKVIAELWKNHKAMTNLVVDIMDPSDKIKPYIVEV